jgi:hypothetical protein
MSNFLLNLKGEEQSESIVESLKVFFKRLKGIVVSPIETMRNLEIKPNLLYPILMIIVVVIATLLLNTGSFKEYSRQELIKANVQENVERTAEKIEQIVNRNVNVRLFAIPFMTLFIWVVGTAILFLLIKVLKGKGTFKEFLTITGYAYIILIFSGVLEAFVIFITGDNNKEFSITSLALILPQTLKGNFFYGIAKGIEIFTIWNYFIVGIGICYVSKLSKAKVYGVIGVMFVWPLILGGIGEVLSKMV